MQRRRRCSRIQIRIRGCSHRRRRSQRHRETLDLKSSASAIDLFLIVFTRVMTFLCMSVCALICIIHAHVIHRRPHNIYALHMSVVDTSRTGKAPRHAQESHCIINTRVTHDSRITYAYMLYIHMYPPPHVSCTYRLYVYVTLNILAVRFHKACFSPRFRPSDHPLPAISEPRNSRCTN